MSIVIGAILYFMFSSFVYAQDTNIAEQMALNNAVEIAIKNNPGILIAQKELEVVFARKLQTTALPNPELEGEWVGEDSKIGLSQLFEFPTKYFLKNSIGDYEIEIEKAKLEKAKYLLIADVKKAYYKIILSKKIIENIKSTIDLLKQFLEITNIKYKSGKVAYLEVVRVKVELAKSKNELIEEKKEFLIQQQELNLLLGRKSNESFMLTQNMIYEPFNKNIEQVQNEILKKNYALKIAKLSLGKSEKNKSLGWSSLLPDFNISVYKSRAGELSGWGAEFKMSIPLYFWMEQTGKIKEASANLDSNQIKLEAVRKNIISAIKNTYESVQANEEQVKNFEQNLLPEVEDGLKTGINNYQTGQIDVLNLIDIYRTYKFARIEREKTLYNYLESLANLEIAGEEKE